MAQEELRKERSRYSAALEIEIDNCLAAWLRLKDQVNIQIYHSYTLHPKKPLKLNP